MGRHRGARPAAALMARRGMAPRREAPGAPWGWALLGALLGLLAAVIFFAPARWLAAGVKEVSQGHVLLEAPRGTVWDGSAQLVLAGGVDSRDATALPGRLEWTLRPTLSGASALLVNRCCMTEPIRLNARLSTNGAQLALADGASQWPAGLLVGLGAPWNTLQPEGQLKLSTQSFLATLTDGRWAIDGLVRLEATDVSSRLSTLRPMGSYLVTLSGGPAPALKLETLSGSLLLAGTGQFVGTRLKFEGTASATPDRIDALANLLNVIGRRDGARSIIKVG
ncbi:MAG: type II secretion system protein N [Burkholderiales bacterium]